MRKLVLIVLFALLISIFPVISSSGELENAQKIVRQNPSDAMAHYKLGGDKEMKTKQLTFSLTHLSVFVYTEESGLFPF
jgi:hypothetical protein